MSLQGKDTNILNLYDKVGGFQKKAKLWKTACAQGNLTCFPQVDGFLSNEDVDRAPVKSVIVGHLTNLIQDFHFYFEICTAGLGEKSISIVRSKQKQATCHLSGKTPGSVIWPWLPDEVFHLHIDTVLVVCEAGVPWPGAESFGAAITLCLHIFMWDLLLCNDCDQIKAKKQTVPGEELDHSSCLPATKTDKDPQWSTSSGFSLKCQ